MKKMIAILMVSILSIGLIACGAEDTAGDIQEEVADALKQQIFSYDGIAIIVNPANDVTDVTVEQLLGIYSGEITNWSELGGNDAEIFVVSR